MCIHKIARRNHVQLSFPFCCLRVKCEFCLSCVSEKEGKAIQLTYKDKLKLVALTKQVTFGKYRPDVSHEVGFLDVVGNDRR